MQLQITSFTVGPFAENSYLLRRTGSDAAIIVDPGDEGERLWRAISAAGVQLEAILLTHAHLDHVAALGTIRERSGAPVYLHPADDELLAQAHVIWQQFGRSIEPIAPAEHPLHDGQELTLAGITLRVIHTPGHTPGGVCFYVQSEATLIAGDTLFRRGVGRTDLPGGDMATLQRSIVERIFPLEGAGETSVYPGHGSPTTIREEIENNPFVGIR